MRVLIFSDIHGNLPAFEAMLRKEPGIELYISLGDVVNYGPWTNECVDLLESLHAVRLRGNHEDDLLKGSYSGSNSLVRNFFEICANDFSRPEQIQRYEHEHSLSDFTCVHTICNEYLFPDSVIHAKGNYFIGHSHYQFDRRGDGFRVVNVGSVGQNRREIDVINYLCFDTVTKHVQLKELVYDVDVLIHEMRARHYPEMCVSYYLNKQRRIK